MRAGSLGIIIYWPAPDHQVLLFCESSRCEKFPLQSSVKMGNAPSSPAHACLLSAVGNDSSLLAFPSQPFYESTAANPYNLNWPVYPAVVATPKTSEQVAGIVECAVEYGHKVQAKSGGRSYANFGMRAVVTSRLLLRLTKLRAVRSRRSQR